MHSSPGCQFKPEDNRQQSQSLSNYQNDPSFTTSIWNSSDESSLSQSQFNTNCKNIWAFNETQFAAQDKEKNYNGKPQTTSNNPRYNSGFFIDSQSCSSYSNNIPYLDLLPSSSSSSSAFGGGPICHLPNWLERDLELTEQAPPEVLFNNSANECEASSTPDGVNFTPAPQQTLNRRNPHSMANRIDEQSSEIVKLKQELDVATKKIQRMEIPDENNTCYNGMNISNSNNTRALTSGISATVTPKFPYYETNDSLFTGNLNSTQTNQPLWFTDTMQQKHTKPTQSHQRFPCEEISNSNPSIDDGLPKNPTNPIRPEFDNSWIPLESAYKNATFTPSVKTASNSNIKRPPLSPNTVKEKDRTPSTIIPVAGTSEVFYPIKCYNEPLNYRKLLEKSVSCNWKFIVDRIVLDNDQQASIFLQQKLKIANQEQKTNIISAIIAQSYLLMINRFGNFLVQRCLEYGNREQVIAITKGMEGRVVGLAMDPFGCHVIQKALDCVDSNMKSNIIQEMLSRVTESVVHRYACHVWQKLFELRWGSETPPRFMKQVNKDLEGMWTKVALGETGSLVVQNIFENCIDEDKNPCIEEVVGNLDTIIKGQWGNWVIQHMVEHASEPYRDVVIKFIINQSPIYSIDQFASKAVEKMLKMGDPIIIQMFLDKVTEKQPERPRIPLIDIASDAHGNYLIQYILQSGSPSQKEEVAVQIRKHMVSLKGSKWGSKCAWLIDKNRYHNNNNLYATRKEVTKLHRTNNHQIP